MALKKGTTWFSSEKGLAVRNEAHQVAITFYILDIILVDVKVKR